MPTNEIAWLNEEFVPAVDPEDVKAAWNFFLDIKERKVLQGRTNDHGLNPTTIQAVNFRMELLYQAVDRGLLEMGHNRRSDAIFKAIAKVPVKVTPNLQYEGLPCDLNELLQLIETEKGRSSGPHLQCHVGIEDFRAGAVRKFPQPENDLDM